MVNVTHEQGMRAPASELRTFSSTYYHIKSGKTYVQKTFPIGNEWVEELIGDAEAIAAGIVPTAVDNVTIHYNAFNQLEVLATGGETLAQTLALGNESGANNIRMSGKDITNVTGPTPGGSIGLIFSESNDWVYLASDGYWQTGSNSGVFASNDGGFNSGYVAMFGADWASSFECAAGYAGYYAANSSFSVYLGEDKGGDWWQVQMGGQQSFSSADVRSTFAQTDNATLGMNAIGSVLCRTEQDSGVGADQITRGVTFMSSNGARFGFNGQLIEVPQYCAIISDSNGTIQGDNVAGPANTVTYNTLISNFNSVLTSTDHVAVIASNGVDVTDLQYLTVLSHSGSTLIGGDLPDYSTLVDNLYVDGRANFRATDDIFANVPIAALTPAAPADGDIWLQDTVGVRTFNARIAGVTYSVTLT